MMRIVGHTSFDFIRWRGPAMTVSLLLIAVGVGATVMRGKELLDIDFTGGSSVQIVFAEGKSQPIADVRTAVAELPDVAVSSVGEGDLEFKIDTSDNDVDHVQSVLQQTFKSSLETYTHELRRVGHDRAGRRVRLHRRRNDQAGGRSQAGRESTGSGAGGQACRIAAGRKRFEARPAEKAGDEPGPKSEPKSEPAAPEGDQSSAARHGPFQLPASCRKSRTRSPPAKKSRPKRRRRNPAACRIV